MIAPCLSRPYLYPRKPQGSQSWVVAETLANVTERALVFHCEAFVFDGSMPATRLFINEAGEIRALLAYKGRPPGRGGSRSLTFSEVAGAMTAFASGQ